MKILTMTINWLQGYEVQKWFLTGPTTVCLQLLKFKISFNKYSEDYH